ncbi:MAG TPA: tRNA (adenosine(37)-N6)-threonylcarbamoyltransferase complex dimerization subunit type 1 TsaB [Tepidisphaeraceae bacterium]|jgi:tRNA threonylcarbamoyladenosine biosynthesis protein TsaB
MSRALAIETSGKIGSVAVACDGTVLAEESFPHHFQHAAGLMPLVDQLMRGVGWKPADIDCVCVSVGPGSFTGLRIGVTAAKTIAFATGARLVAVPTTRVLLANAPAEAREVVVVLDAKRGQIFTARFTHTGDPWTEAEPEHLDTLAAMLARSTGPVHLIGEGLPYHTDAAVDERAIVTPESAWQARAAAVAVLGHAKAAAGDFIDPFRLTPVYVRRPEPEEKRLAAEAAAAVKA